MVAVRAKDYATVVYQLEARVKNLRLTAYMSKLTATCAAVTIAATVARASSTAMPAQVGTSLHTLNPCFSQNGHAFEAVSLRSMLRVLVWDRRGRLDTRLLGQCSLPAAAVPGTDPVYLWLPLTPPTESGGPLRLPLLKVCRLDAR